MCLFAVCFCLVLNFLFQLSKNYKTVLSATIQHTVEPVDLCLYWLCKIIWHMWHGVCDPWFMA